MAPVSTVAFAVAAMLSAAPASPPAAPSKPEATLKDIKATLGFVPMFMQQFPDEALPGAWEEFKAIQLNANSAVPPKYKELMGLAIASQIPCEYCVYFHTRAAKANGASDRELKEAVAMSAVVRHWSTYLNGAQIDDAAFKKELGQIVSNAKAAAGKPAPEAMAVTDAASAKEDIKRTLGLVPGFFSAFPAEGLAGAWREMKEFQMSPNTAIPPKYKELIGLGVAAQIPCKYCVAFHTEAASQLNGASQAEVQETLALASIVRHWSTVLNGMQLDMNQFKKEADKLTTPKKTAAVPTTGAK